MRVAALLTDICLILYCMSVFAQKKSVEKKVQLIYYSPKTK